MVARVGDHAQRHVGIRNHRGGGAQLLRQAQRSQDLFTSRRGQALQSRRLHIDGVPFCIQLTGETGRRANHPLRPGARPHAGQQGVRRFPHGTDCLVGAIRLDIALDAIGGPPQREFAQRHQIALAEEIVGGALDLLRQIDLAGPQAFQQFVGGDIDQDHLFGIVEDGIRHGLPYAHIGDAAHHVVEALQMLNIQRRENVDARRQQFFDVLPSLRVARALHIRVSEFVDQDERGTAQQRGVEIEFVEIFAPIFHEFRGKNFQIGQERGRLRAAVSLDDADDDVPALAFELSCRGQHGIGLAHARRRSEVDPQFAAPGIRLLTVDLRQQQVRIGALFGRCRHRPLLCAIQR